MHFIFKYAFKAHWKLFDEVWKPANISFLIFMFHFEIYHFLGLTTFRLMEKFDTTVVNRKIVTESDVPSLLEIREG